MALSARSRNAFAVALAAIALTLLVIGWWKPAPPLNKAVHLELGRTLAAESLKLLKPGGKLTIIARDTDVFPQPAMALALTTLQKELRRAGAEIRSTQLIQLDPIRPSAVPSGDFYELLRRLPEGDVIISLLGPPLLSEEHKEKLGRPRARVVALCSGVVENSDALFASGLLQAAIVNKASATSAQANSFDQLYTIVRADSKPVAAAL
jgi:hypothetical protein